LDGIRERAKQKAKVKADSIRAAEEARTSMLVLELYSLLERGRAEEAFNKFNANLVALEAYVYPDALHTISSSVTQAYQTWRDEKNDLEQMIATVAPSTTADDLKANQEKASSHITEIYTMLEQGKAKEAFSLFKKIRDKLKQHTCKEAFEMVETMVNQAYAALSSSDNSKMGRK
jgi:alpha-acetolactate decarboxylase